jgi:hypothetical protein
MDFPNCSECGRQISDKAALVLVAGLLLRG